MAEKSDEVSKNDFANHLGAVDKVAQKNSQQSRRIKAGIR